MLPGPQTIRKERKESSSSSENSSEEPSSSESSSSSEDEGKKGGKKVRARKSLRQFRHETLIRQRMVEARPKREEDKFGGDKKVNYLNFKQRFQAVTEIGGANPLDVLNELVHWLRDGPRKLADAHMGSKRPRKALRQIWKQLDQYFDSQVETAAERIKPILAKGKIDKDDVDSLIDLQSDLLAVQTQARNAGMAKELDRQDVVRDLVTKRLPFMADEFYRAETRKQRKDPKFRMAFDDLMVAIQERARTLKAQGVSSKRETTQTAKVAATSGQTTETWSSKVASPPKEQAPAQACFNCNSVRHGVDKCNELRHMGMEKLSRN